MSAIQQISHGALTKIIRNERVDNAVLQVLNFRPVNDKSGQDRMRLLISDGLTTHTHVIVIAQHLVDKFNKGEFDKFCLVKVIKYVVNKIENEGKTLLILQDLELVQPGSQINRRLDAGHAGSESVLANPTGNMSSRVVKTEGQNSAFPNSTTDRARLPQGSSPSPARQLNINNVCPIDAITPFFNAWVIRARVTLKGQKRTYTNARGEGCVFSFDVADERSEIKFTAFNKEAEKFYDLIEKGKVYYISKGNVKTANTKFNNLKNDYEITISPDTVIQLCDDTSSTSNIPTVRYSFVEIKDIENHSKSTVDVIGIIKSYDQEVSSVVSKKTNIELKKREMTIVDKSGSEVRFTLWGEEAEHFRGPTGAVIAIKNALIGEFNGKTLGSISSTSIQIDPDIPEAHVVKGWYNKEGNNMTFHSLSKSKEGGSSNNSKYISQINMTTVMPDQKNYYNMTGYILSTGKTPLYKACDQNGCMKKVVDENNGQYHCSKCGRDSENFVWRMILSMSISDCTGEMWGTLFQENAEKLLGITAKDLSVIQEDPAKFSQVLNDIQFKKYHFRNGANVDHYNNETRIKSTIYQVNPIDQVKYGRSLLKTISAFNAQY